MQLEVEITDRGAWVDQQFKSLDEMADHAEKMIGKAHAGSYNYKQRMIKAIELAHNGWDGGGAAIESLDIIRENVKTSMQLLNLDTMAPRFDVAGGSFDLGRYLAGDPENMVGYHMVQTSRVGKVIRLCASVDAYAGVSLYKRGLGIVALVEALNQCGHAVELWLDVFCNRYQGFPNTSGGQIRCLIKGVEDTLDMSKVMFGYAYEDTMRALGMPCTHYWPKEYHSANQIGSGYGAIGNPRKDLPEGTLYIPHAMHGLDLDPGMLTMVYLVQLGLAADPGNLPPFNIWNDEGYDENDDNEMW